MQDNDTKDGKQKRNNNIVRFLYFVCIMKYYLNVDSDKLNSREAIKNNLSGIASKPILEIRKEIIKCAQSKKS